MKTVILKNIRGKKREASPMFLPLSQSNSVLMLPSSSWLIISCFKYVLSHKANHYIENKCWKYMLSKVLRLRINFVRFRKVAAMTCIKKNLICDRILSFKDGLEISFCLFFFVLFFIFHLFRTLIYGIMGSLLLL